MLTDSQLSNAVYIVRALKEHASDQTAERHQETEELGYMPDIGPLEFDLFNAANFLEEVVAELIAERIKLRTLRSGIFELLQG